MRYAFPEDPNAPKTSWLARLQTGIDWVMGQHGHVRIPDPDQADLVFHTVSPAQPRPFRRRARATFVIGIADATEVVSDTPVLARAYPVMIRSLSNLLIYGVTERDAERVYMVTPELGCYEATTDPNSMFEDIYTRLEPLATSHLVIDNVFDPDLPEELAEGTQVTRELTEAARTLDSWDLFPAPYPIADMLPPEDYRHLRHVFGIGGLSYGNLSARHDRHRFWMSASGVDKGKIGTVGRDILLVKEYDPEANAMRISVLPEHKPLRVSVDAVEHWQVYERHPEIGAMIHIHAWVEGVRTTEVNYPCGTVEMGGAMSNLFEAEEHPEETVIGLKNHGITATGPDFPSILRRLEGRVLNKVPMM